MTFGVTSEGFVPKTLQDILTSLRDRQRASIDPNWLADDESLEGQINASVAAELTEVWEEVDFLANQLNPDDQEGIQQDMVCALTGTSRIKATKGFADINLNVSGVATFPTGTLVAQEGDETNVWSLRETFIAPGAGTYLRRFDNQTAGRKEAPAGTLTVRLSSVSNWVGADNPADAVAGRDDETDTELAIRREVELRSLGGASEPAISADVEEINPTAIRSVKTLSNEGDVTDVNGLPPHSFEIIIWDPAPDGPVDNDVIAQAIWDTKAFGIATAGSSSGTAVTKSGQQKTVKFSRPTNRALAISVDIVVSSAFPVGGDDLVKEALKNLASTLKPGDTIYLLDYRATIKENVEGVLDVPHLRAALSATPTLENNLTTTLREIATLDTSDITVNHV